MSQKHLQITLNDQSFTLSEVPKTYDELVSKIAENLKTSLPVRWTLVYEDCDNDLVMLNHAEDYEGLLIELRAAEKFVKIVIVVKEGQSSINSIPNKEEQESLSELSMDGSEDSYNVLDNGGSGKKEGPLSDEDVIEVSSLAASQNIKEIKPEIKEEEKIMKEESVSEIKAEGSSRMDVSQQKSEVAKEEYLTQSIIEKREESMVQEADIVNKSEANGESFALLGQEKQEDMLMSSQHSVISKKEVEDLAANESNLASLVAGSSVDKNNESSVQNKILTESTEMLYKNEPVQEPRQQVLVGEENYEEIMSELDKKNIHNGIHCDGCDKQNIVGIRYKCSVCKDFDFCEVCEATKKHEHAVFLKIKTPEDAKELQREERKANIFEQIDNKLCEWEDEIVEKFNFMLKFLKGGRREEANEGGYVRLEEEK